MKQHLTYILLLLLSMPASAACNNQPLDFNDALQRADFVFSAQVENIQYLDDPQEEKNEPRIIVSMKTLEVWKGEEKANYQLHTTHNKWSCNGYAFRSGERYLVFARKQHRADNFLARLFAPEQATIGVKLYGGTKPLNAAQSELNALSQSSASFQ